MTNTAACATLAQNARGANLGNFMLSTNEELPAIIKINHFVIDNFVDAAITNMERHVGTTQGFSGVFLPHLQCHFNGGRMFGHSTWVRHNLSRIDAYANTIIVASADRNMLSELPRRYKTITYQEAASPNNEHKFAGIHNAILVADGYSHNKNIVDNIIPSKWRNVIKYAILLG